MVQIKSIMFVNGDNLINEAWLKAIKWSILYNIDNNKDIQKMVYYQNILNIINVYKTNKSKFVVFYYNADKWKNNKKNFLKKLASILPVFISDSSYQDVCDLLSDNCPEYDEIISNWISNTVIYSTLIKICKKERFNALHNDLRRELKEIIKIIS